MSIAINKKVKFDGARCPFLTFLRLQGDHHCACAQKWCHFSFFPRAFNSPRFSAAGMVRMKNHEKSGWVHLIWNPGQVLIAGCGETPGRARTFISDQSKEVSQDRERRRKLHRCIQTAIDSARRDWSSARRDWRIFFQTFQPSFIISWPISTNEPSLESLNVQQSDGAIFVPVSPRERTIAPFLRRVLTLSAQFPRIRTCSSQINLYRGEIAVCKPKKKLRLYDQRWLK